VFNDVDFFRNPSTLLKQILNWNLLYWVIIIIIIIITTTTTTTTIIIISIITIIINIIAVINVHSKIGL
jgi:hypothetical protein